MRLNAGRAGQTAAALLIPINTGNNTTVQQLSASRNPVLRLGCAQRTPRDSGVTTTMADVSHLPMTRGANAAGAATRPVAVTRHERSGPAHDDQVTSASLTGKSRWR